VAGVNGYAPEQWHDFAVAAAGAAAALTGLLFVAISINLQRILQFAPLPARAFTTLSSLASLLIVSLFILAPGQRNRVIGTEIAACGLLVAVLAVSSIARVRRSDAVSTKSQVAPLGTVVLPALLLFVAGLSLLTGSGGGLYWLLFGVILGFIGAVIDAWVLLIEIMR
jgi:modulator of FtsH protease